MRNLLYPVAILALILTLTSSCGEKITPDDPDPVVPAGTFVKGADISWVTEMESKGYKFYNAAGQERECTALMKELGMDAVRLRVWVNPTGGWNGRDDVVVKARRAQQRKQEQAAHEKNVRTGKKKAEKTVRPEQKAATPVRQRSDSPKPGRMTEKQRQEARQRRRRTAQKEAARDRYAQSRPVKKGKGSKQAETNRAKARSH